MPLQPSLLTAALAALPFAAERDVVYALRCLRACIACMLEGPDGKALAADSWQLLQRSSLAHLAATVTREYSSTEPLVLLMAAICKQCLHVVERAAPHNAYPVAVSALASVTVLRLLSILRMCFRVQGNVCGGLRCARPCSTCAWPGLSLTSPSKGTSALRSLRYMLTLGPCESWSPSCWRSERSRAL